MNDFNITVDTLNKKNDCFVRYLFSNLGNEKIVLNFVNAVMDNLNFKTFETLEILNPFNLQKYLNSKESVVDIKCTADTGEVVIIEIQLQGNETFIKRTLFYWASNYSLNLNKGDDYNKLLPVISINILDFVLFDGIEDCYSCYILKELKHNKILTDHCQFHFLELPKFNHDKQLNKDLNSWYKFFIGGERMSNLIKENTIFDEVDKKCKSFISENPLLDVYKIKEAEEYFQRETLHRELEKGIEKGIEKGREEGKKYSTLIIAKSMKEDGADFQLISKYTGLSVEEIERL
ncbi:Rpn family recombination-promoting nuclease/putative transposase [Brachyspira sp. SAP_772]|uniref:Rpn family recombination-promoting nuclease/putative transposase n=1 Tax=Brachyspira sp. SAP_772 TaxID=2608385 RepID=UPI0012F4F58B|nr:Rpn family recombination-promoting nuclease/putative transposase [Brachyspira sp. SAP_772]